MQLLKVQRKAPEKGISIRSKLPPNAFLIPTSRFCALRVYKLQIASY